MKWGWSDTIGLICLLATLALIVWGVVSCAKGTSKQWAEQQLCLENGYNDYKWVNGVTYCTGIRGGRKVTIRAERLK